MFNKTDTTSNQDKQKPALLPSATIEKNGSEKNGSGKNGSSSLVLFSEPPPLAPRKLPDERLPGALKRMKLRTKATLMAIAIGTIPVLGLGTVAYFIASNSISDRITSIQTFQAEDMADTVNRFMFERYGDIQVLANLPIFSNSRIASISSLSEKQEILNKYVSSYRVYDSIAAFDLEGNVIAQSQGEPLPNHKEFNYFQQVLKSDRPLITQPQISRVTNKPSVFLVAPIKDSNSGQTIGVIRTRMPVSVIDALLKAHINDSKEYYFSDALGNIFISAPNQRIGSKINQEFSDLPKTSAVSISKAFVSKSNNQERLVSYTSRSLDGLPNLQWKLVLANDTAIAFEAQNQLALATLLGTGVIAATVGLIAYWLAKRATTPLLEATRSVERIGRGDLKTRVKVNSQDELGDLGDNINHMAEQLQTFIEKQELDAQRARTLADVTIKMRYKLQTGEIIKTAVWEIRQAINSDRVLFYKFNTETWDGVVVAESVAVEYPKMLGEEIDDPCFRERHIDIYKDGKVRAISDISREPGLKGAKCYTEMLAKYDVKANLIAPVVTNEELIGLLIAHQCDAPRIWQPAEIDFFRQISTQMGFALEQGSLVEQIEAARKVAEKTSVSERQQKEALQMQLLELLSEVEGAASGDLTVRADVTAGEIGTVADFFNSIVESLREIVTQVKQTATQVNTSISHNSGAIDQLSTEAIAQAEEINRTLDAVANMARSMQSVAMSAQQAAEVANDARKKATNSGYAMDRTVKSILNLRETVGETAKKVKRLGESTQQISRVVALINQISMQTNLLAINAGIEAGRAGEEAQGFAVVAEEVGELAARSAAATKEIEQIVENIQRETTEVVHAMEQGTTQVVEGTHVVEDAKQSLSQILDVSRQIDTLIQSISTATSSQLETSTQVSQLMEGIADVSKRTSDSSRQVSKSLQKTVEISQKLQDTVGAFKVE